VGERHTAEARIKVDSDISVKSLKNRDKGRDKNRHKDKYKDRNNSHDKT